MQRWARVAAVLAIALGIGTLTADDKKPADGKKKPTEDKKKPADTPAAKPVTDAEFVVIAASSGMYEVESSKMAKERAASEAVKKFADHMITDHTKANKELTAAAKKAGLGLPVQMLDSDIRQLNALRGKTGAEFDRLYIMQQVQAHDDAVALFETESKNAKAAEIKDFATKTLPTLKEHQTHIRMLSKNHEK